MKKQKKSGEANFPVDMIESYLPALKSLNALKLDWGRNDELKHIPITCLQFSKKLEAFGVKHFTEEYLGGHIDKQGGLDGRIYTEMLPFSDTYLKVEDKASPGSKTDKRKEPLKPFTVPPKEPLVPGPGKVDMRTIIHANQTNNQFSGIDGAVAPMQMGPSPHVHKDLDELMYVLEGTAFVLIGTEIYEVKAGGFIFRPHGISHSFCNASDLSLRFIDCFFNQNFEDYWKNYFIKFSRIWSKITWPQLHRKLRKKLMHLIKNLVSHGSIITPGHH